MDVAEFRTKKRFYCFCCSRRVEKIVMIMRIVNFGQSVTFRIQGVLPLFSFKINQHKAQIFENKTLLENKNAFQ